MGGETINTTKIRFLKKYIDGTKQENIHEKGEVVNYDSGAIAFLITEGYAEIIEEEKKKSEKEFEITKEEAIQLNSELRKRQKTPIDFVIDKQLEEMDIEEGIIEPTEGTKKKKKKEIKEKIIEVSRITKEKVLWEQIYDPETKTSQYMTWNEEHKQPIFVPYVIKNGEKHYPISDDLLQKDVIILPTGVTEYGTEEDLEKEISLFISTWLEVSEEHLQKATWYIMLSWLIDKLHTMPYLRALGDYGTGKTRYLDVIGGICYKPMFVGGAVKSAPIFRIIDFWRGTMILDEFTLEKSDETQDIIQILNNGFQRGKAVIRCDAMNYDKVKAFDPFGAKILSTRSTFKDKALESRCITEIMKMTANRTIPRDLTEDFYKKRAELQNKLLMYRFKNINKIKPDESAKIDFGNIMPRIQQTLSPFTILFQYNEERLKSFIKYAQDYNRSIIEENSMSLDGQLINVYVQLIKEHEVKIGHLDDYVPPVISTTEIRTELINDGWKEESISTATIGRRLKSLGFKTKVVRIGTKTKRNLNINDGDLDILKMKYVVTDVTVVTDTCDTTQNTL